MTAPLHLLDDVARQLREDLAPTLDSGGRYQALLCAKAVDTARRELDVASRLETLEQALPSAVAAFRDGQHDNDDTLYRTLLDVAILRAYIADPNALRDKEGDRLAALRR